MGPPRHHDEAIAVVRRAREQGADHIDTASFYGPDVANRLLREALDPWPADLRIVSKVGVVRDDRGGWIPALGPDDVRAAVARDLDTLGIDRLTAVNLRVLDTPDEVFLGALGALVGLQGEGAIELIGLSNVDVRHLDLAEGHAGAGELRLGQEPWLYSTASPTSANAEAALACWLLVTHVQGLN